MSEVFPDAYRTIANVNISASVTSIRAWAFEDCSGIMNIEIPDGVTRIEYGAFYNCWGLKSVTIPDTVTIIGNQAFSDCISLSSVTIPDSVTSIGDEAFRNCRSLAHVSFPDSVTSVGAGCFEGCPAYNLSVCKAAFSYGDVEPVDPRYTLSSSQTDRSIASITVDGDCAFDGFVLADGKVYDLMLYVSNTADREVTLSLPAGHTYKTVKGASPLVIPAESQCLISITRVAPDVFLVMREELDDVQ
jgi:hypothetical protein